MGLHAYAKLDPWQYADSLGVVVVGADQLDLPAQHADQLLRVDESAWSGLTLSEGRQTMVVLNTAHGAARQCSTLMHELSHIRLGHIPASVQLSRTGMLLLSDYGDDQEDEADWLMGALLLPRQALLHHRRQGSDTPEIAKIFGVSEELCVWRLRMTGVNAQLRYAH